MHFYLISREPSSNLVLTHNPSEWGSFFAVDANKRYLNRWSRVHTVEINDETHFILEGDNFISNERIRHLVFAYFGEINHNYENILPTAVKSVVWKAHQSQENFIGVMNRLNTKELKLLAIESALISRTHFTMLFDINDPLTNHSLLTVPTNHPLFNPQVLCRYRYGILV